MFCDLVLSASLAAGALAPMVLLATLWSDARRGRRRLISFVAPPQVAARRETRYIYAGLAGIWGTFDGRPS
jgi:hypothetical protein